MAVSHKIVLNNAFFKNTQTVNLGQIYSSCSCWEKNESVFLQQNLSCPMCSWTDLRSMALGLVLRNFPCWDKYIHTFSLRLRLLIHQQLSHLAAAKEGGGLIVEQLLVEQDTAHTYTHTHTHHPHMARARWQNLSQGHSGYWLICFQRSTHQRIKTTLFMFLCECFFSFCLFAMGCKIKRKRNLSLLKVT